MEPLTTSPSMAELMTDPKIENLIEHLRNKLRCSLQANDLERVAQARDQLTKFQNHELFESILGTTEKDPCATKLDLDAEVADDDNDIENQTQSSQNVCSCEWLSDEGDEEECLKDAHAMETYVEPPENSWHGYFQGYEILDPSEEFNISETKKCIEINKNTPDDMLEGLIRAGIKCFCIDLFVGTSSENQQLVLRLRESELCISKEMGYPYTTTLFLKLSPRLQYTGDLDACLLKADDPKQLMLEKNDKVILTIKAEYSMKCSKEIIFVNARLLMEDVHPCDIILIGPDIQLFVKSTSLEKLNCIVLVGGVLESRLPVLFPARCKKFHVSVEELEDITFAQELGVNVIVSYMIGTKEYFEDLKKILQAFQYEKMRLFARVVLNELKGCENDFEWAAVGYDGFIIEFTPPPDANQAEILHLCPAAEQFLERVFQLKKPIIMNPGVLSQQQLVVEPAHYLHIFYYPDKYLFNYTDLRSAFRFFCLQTAIYEPLPKEQLSQLPYCDASEVGSDSLALAAVSAAFEMQATAIFVLGLTGRMAMKLAHFRPNVPIIFITQMKSAAQFICLYHNIIMLHYGSKAASKSHRSAVYKHFLYGLLFTKSRKIIRHADNVVFVYGQEPGTKFPDKYISYKFDEKYFAVHLGKILFPK